MSTYQPARPPPSVLLQTWLFPNNGDGSGCYVTAGGCTVIPGASGYTGQTTAALPPLANRTVDTAALPQGCSVVMQSTNGTAYFNTRTAGTSACGAGGDGVLSGSATSLLTFSVSLDPKAAAGTGVATITLVGPDGKWFGCGLGAQAMAEMPNAIIVSGNGTVFEQKLDNQAAGRRLATSVAVTSNGVVGGVRTVTMTRAFKGITADHYTFDPAKPSIDFVNAVGQGASFAYHGNTRAAATLSLQVGRSLGGYSRCPSRSSRILVVKITVAYYSLNSGTIVFTNCTDLDAPLRMPCRPLSP